MAATEQIVNGSLVIIGAFAPAMFTPEWFLKNNLIGETDREEMLKDGRTIVSASGSQVESETLSITITPTRLQLLTKDVLRPVIKDVALNMLQLLGRVPVTMVGLNFMGHYSMGSQDEYHAVGDTLAPKDIWKKVFDNPSWSVGLTDLSVKVHPAPRGEKNDVRDGITVRVQPSAQVDQGILLTYNNHKEINDSDPKLFSDEVAYDFINAHWDESLQDSRRVFGELLKLTTTKGN